MPMPVIVAVYCTPLGKAGGVFEDVRDEDLSVTLIDHILDEHNVDLDDVEDLTWGIAQQRAEQDNNVARVIAFLSTLGKGTSATSINRWCASLMQAIISVSDVIVAGNRECIVAGGVEGMSRVPTDGDSYEHLHPELGEQCNIFQLQAGTTAEKVTGEYEVSREAQDELTSRSHQRAAEVTDLGRFDDEIVPIETADGVATGDEGIRRDTSVEILGDFDPAFSGDGSVITGNSSQITDGAAAVPVTNRGFAEDRGLDVLASVGMNNIVGVNPAVMGIGPVLATRGLLDRAGTDIDDYGLIEINEASASQCKHFRRELGIDADSLNVNGGATVLGHPLRASDARLPVTFIHEMQKRDVDCGLVLPCVGFGQGAAVEFSG